MLTRVEVSGTQRYTYTQQWDVDNRLIAVTSTATLTVTRFYYDGDGQRVKRVESKASTTITTAYVGAHFEKNVTTGVTTTYYYAGATRVAMRQGSSVYYLHGDHLGSASLTTDYQGSKLGELRYTPYGETRYVWGSTPTDRRFTGQREEAALGSLYDYGARFYSPSLNRFISPDTIVPSPGNPQSLNRYSYVRNSPLNCTDPSGHCGICKRVIKALVVTADRAASWVELRAGEAASWMESGANEIATSIGPNPSDHSVKSTQQAMGIASDWFFETGPEQQEFGPDEPLTQDVRYDPQVDTFKEQWAEKGYPLPFKSSGGIDKREGSLIQRMTSGAGAFIVENGELGLSLLGFGSPTPQGRIDAVGGVIGSFGEFGVSDAGGGVLKFSAYNVSGLRSVTRIPGTNRGLVPNKARSERGPGGTMSELFTWFEGVSNFD
jgi:RHS repeat-associated protein